MFTFLIAARLHPEKGFEDLFEAVRTLKGRTQRPFVLLVAGDGRFLGRYQDLVTSLGIADCVRFLGFRTDLADVMVASDVFTLPSVAEAFGLVLAEALYLGLPVLASRVGGIPEVVDDGIDGCLVPPGNPVALSRAMESFLFATNLHESARMPGMLMQPFRALPFSCPFVIIRGIVPMRPRNTTPTDRIVLAYRIAVPPMVVGDGSSSCHPGDTSERRERFEV